MNWIGSVLHEEISIWRFWAELIPLLSIIVLTLLGLIGNKRKILLHLTGKLVYNIILGCVIGAIWLGVSIRIGVIHIDGRNQISMLWLWMALAQLFWDEYLWQKIIRIYLI